MEKRKQNAYVITTLITVLAVVALLFFIIQERNDKTEVCFDNVCAGVEIAETLEERALGLMFQESLSEDRGMLFIFKEAGNYPFWMKNTLIPLDIIWINSDFVVAEIASAIPCLEDPCRNYGGNKMTKYVLEVNAGFVREHGIRVGDIVEIN